MLANTGSDIILAKNYSVRQKTQKTEMFFVLQKGNDLEKHASVFHHSMCTALFNNGLLSQLVRQMCKNNWVVSKFETFKDLFRSLKFAT